MNATAFVIDYARYRRLGFSELEAMDFALSRPRGSHELARRLEEHRVPARSTPAPLRAVK